MATAVDLLITGRVQGVGFRYHAAAEALRLEVVGWVRNEPDGRVAVHAEGPDEAVEELVRWCRSGPPSAKVEQVDVRESAATGAASFEVRHW